MFRRIVLTQFLVIFLGCLCLACQSSTSRDLSVQPSEQALPDQPSPTPADEAEFEALRLEMVGKTILARGVQNEAVLEAMRTVPRHKFVLPEYQEEAYADHPLPIGYGQTISQPFIVALMTEHLDLQPGEKVLEIGTGSGYQAAVLASLPGLDLDVYSIEIVPELAERTANLLSELGLTAIHLRQGDGYYGWEEAAPFDAIIVTAAPDHLPPPLAAQLAEGGRLVIPIGLPGAYQSLWKFILEDGQMKAVDLGPVSFVRFTGEGIQEGDASGSKTPSP